MDNLEYNQCVDLFSDGLYRFILKNIRREHEAQDAVQHAFQVLWERRESLLFEKAKSYLFSVAHNYMIDQIRKQKKMDYHAALPESSGYDKSDRFDVRAQIQKGLSQLPEIQRSVILLRDYEGYSYREIGNILDISEAQVKVYIFRARQKLKNYLVSIDKVL